MTNERAQELLGKMIDKLLRDESKTPEEIYAELLVLGFTIDELDELGLSENTVFDDGDENQE